MTRDRTVKEPKGHFSATRNSFLESALSIEAKGALSYFLALNDKSNISISKFQRDCKIGRDKARRILHELEEAGHIVREECHENGNGQFYYTWHIYDSPVANSPLSDSQSPVDVVDPNRSTTLNDDPYLEEEKNRELSNTNPTSSLFPKYIDQQDTSSKELVTSITPPLSPPIEEKKKKRKPSKRSQFSQEMQDTFCAISNCSPPVLKTAKDRKEAGELWFRRLWFIYGLFRPEEERQGEVKLVYDYDSLEKAKDLIEETVQRMKDENLIIAFPKSIVAVATSIWVEGNFEPEEEFVDWTMYKEAQPEKFE